jgi:hypothetical protein
MSDQKTSDASLRKAYRDYWQGYREHTQSTTLTKNRQYPPLPAALRDLTCGAKTRSGQPCSRTDLYESGRCKLHGGLSTGPLSDAGKQKSGENGKLGGRGRVRKPNPTDSVKNRWYLGSDVNLKTAPGLATQLPQISPPESINRTVRVQCRDCENLSAGFTCLSPASGQSVPAMGEWRVCAQFVAAVNAV